MLFNGKSEDFNYELEDLTNSECESVKPNGIIIKVWKCLGEEGVKLLTKLFNKILHSKKIQES